MQQLIRQLLRVGAAMTYITQKRDATINQRSEGHNDLIQQRSQEPTHHQTQQITSCCNPRSQKTGSIQALPAENDCSPSLAIPQGARDAAEPRERGAKMPLSQP